MATFQLTGRAEKMNYVYKENKTPLRDTESLRPPSFKADTVGTLNWCPH